MNFRFLMVPALVGLASVQSASADQISITQDKAIAGGVSSGDAPGFPIQVTDPGSYRLDSDLYPAGATHGIFISSPNVTLDFNGFRMSGGSQATDGILVSTISGVTISNGTITQFRRYGIFGVFAHHLTVDRMKIEGIAGLQGSAIPCQRFCVVRDSTITGNNAGIDNYPWSTHEIGDGNIPILIVGNIVAGNTDFQIKTGGGLILGNVISGQNPITGDTHWVGYGNNTIVGAGDLGGSPLQPNFCEPSFLC